MNPEELSKILEDHKKWLEGNEGKRADLQGADLRGADLRGAETENTILTLTKFRALKDAIKLAKKLFSREWVPEQLAKEFNLYKLPNENRALIAFSEDLSGGFCFVHSRKEIWWWNWVCPSPETVTVLWKMEE